MSKKKKIIIGIVLVVTICIIGVEWYNHNKCTASFESMNGSSEIITNKAEKGYMGSIGVDVKEGEKLIIKSYLKKGSIKINLGKQETAQTGKETIGELLDMMNGKDISQIVEGYNTYELEVPEGIYYGSASVLEKTTGRVTITSESKLK